MPKRKYYLYIAEIGGDALDEDLVERNPNRDPAKSIVKVGYLAGHLPRTRFAGNDFSDAAPILAGHGVRLLPLLGSANPYARGFWKEEGVLSGLEEVVERLRDEGYTVHNRPLPKRYWLYVIELERKILEQRRPNDRYAPGTGSDEFSAKPVYVGQTGKTREERFQEHQRGHNTNVQAFVLRLRDDLTEPMRPLDRLRALRCERKLAWRLGRSGHPVYGGH